MEAILQALGTDQGISLIGRIFLRGTLVLSGHPAFDEAVRIEGSLPGHYYVYVAGGLRRRDVRGIALLYEDIRTAQDLVVAPEPSHKILADHYPLLLTTEEGYAAIAERISDIHDAYFGLADNNRGLEIRSGVTVNGRHATVILVSAEQYHHVHPVTFTRNGKIGGYWIRCGQASGPWD